MSFFVPCILSNTWPCMLSWCSRTICADLLANATCRYCHKPWPTGSVLLSDGWLSFQCCPLTVKHQGQNNFHPTLADTLEHLKGNTHMQSPKAYYGPSHSLLHRISISGHDIVSVNNTRVFTLPWVSASDSSVNFGASGLSQVEKLVGPDHHFLHLKGVAVFCKSVFYLCF